MGIVRVKEFEEEFEQEEILSLIHISEPTRH